MLLFSLFRNHSQEETILFAVFASVLLVFLIIDLGFFNKKAQKITTKSALYQSIFWVFVSTLFGYLIYVYDAGGNDGVSSLNKSVEYFSAYLTEYALSVDNIFVILLILKYFSVKEEYYHKILFWGILGAIVFRGIFIFVGAYFIESAHWILYVFGVFLIYTGIKIYFEDSDEKIDPEKNPVLKLCKKYLPITNDEMGGKFLVRINHRFMFTQLFLVVILVETTDLIFAVDSIPAAFAITTNEFLIYTSNIFAVMGLRAMFFLLSSIIDRFYLLQKGLSFILFFIGAKMLVEIFDFPEDSIWAFTRNPVLSFMVIIATLTLAIVFSIVIPRKESAPKEDGIV